MMSRPRAMMVLAIALGIGLLMLLTSRSLLGAGGANQDSSQSPLRPEATGFQFAVIGDYGSNTVNEARVADLVAGWDPAFVVTAGDNNYDKGAAATIDRNIGQYYSQFIGNYQGQYGAGSPANRFWPSLGNHDWRSLSCDGDTCAGPYFDYFTLPATSGTTTWTWG